MRKDLSGKIIENIFVIDEAKPLMDTRGFPRRRWNCLCLRCLKKFCVLQQNLLNGNTKSCGCGKSKSLIGLYFGHLKVIGEDYSKIDARGHRIKRWKCLCDCGSIIYVTTQKLKSGHTKSCGCAGSRGEETISRFLSSAHIKYMPQFMFDDLVGIGGYPLRFDFAIMDQNGKLLFLIEYQGIQHRYTMGTQGYGQQQRFYTDKAKKEYCLQHSIPLYEIWYDQDILCELKKILQDNSVLSSNKKEKV